MTHTLNHLVFSILDQVTVHLGQQCMIINWLCETPPLCNGPESPVWVYVCVSLGVPCLGALTLLMYIAAPTHISI